MLFTALIAPYFIDWSIYKKDFEQQASHLLGQKVRVAGDASVRILPLPSIIFEQLSVGQHDNNTPLMTVDRFSANVELAPLLSGDVRVVDMALENPVFNVKLKNDGTIGLGSGEALLVDPQAIRLDKLTLTNATVNVTGLPTGRALQINDIQSDLTAQSLHGPWRISGTGNHDKRHFNFDITTGHLTDQQTMRLKLDLQTSTQPYKVSMDGPVSLEKDRLTWNGKFRLAPLQPSEIAQKEVAEKKLPVKVEGAFKMDSNRLIVPDYRMEIGPGNDPFVLTGKGRTEFGENNRFHLQADGRQINLERLSKLQGQDAPTTARQKVELLRSIVDRVPVPVMAGEIDFEIPAIVAGDTIIREISALFQPFNEEWKVARLKAKLPGSTILEATGRLGREETFGFHGDIVIATRQPSGFANWISGKTEQTHPIIRRLKSAGLQSQVVLTPGQLQFDDFQLILDKNLIEGNLQRLIGDTSNNRSTGIVAKLHGSHISLEELQAVASLIEGQHTAFRDYDLDLALSTEKFTGFGLKASNVDVQARYQEGKLSISKLAAGDFAGAKISSNGQIVNLLAEPEGNLVINIEAKSANQLASIIADRFETYPIFQHLADHPDLTKDTSLQLELDANADGKNSRSRLLVNGMMGGSQISLRGGFKGTPKQPDDVEIDLSADISSARTDLLLRQIGAQLWGFSPINDDLSDPVSITLESTGNAKVGYSTIFSLNSNGQALTAKGLVENLLTEIPGYEFGFTVGAQNIVPLVSSFGYALPGINPVLGDELPMSLIGNIKRANGERALAIDLSKGQLSGTAFKGNLVHKPGANGRSFVSGKLDFDQIFATTITGLALGDSISSGNTHWSDGSFAGPVFKDTDGTISISADTTHLGLREIAKNLKMDITVKNGDFDLSKLSADWGAGHIQGELQLKTSGNNALVKGQLKGENLQLSAIAQLADLPDVMDGTALVTGVFESNGRSPAALISALSGSGVASVTDGTISGLRLTGLEEILTQADQENFEISNETTAPLVAKSFQNGSTQYNRASFPFLLNNGQIKIRKTPIETAEAKIFVNADYDISGQSVRSTLQFKPDPGREVVDGAAPQIHFDWTGPASAPETSIDTAALEGYLSVRAFEQEQRRVELLQASILEKQRLRFEVEEIRKKNRWMDFKRLAALRKAEEEKLAKEKAEAERQALEAEQKAAEIARRQEAERLANESAANTEDINTNAVIPNNQGSGNTQTKILPKLQAPQPNGIFENIEEYLLQAQ